MTRHGWMQGLLLMHCLLMAACTGLPRIEPGPHPINGSHQRLCASPFPAGQWQLTHSIEATLPGGHTGVLIGISTLSSLEKKIRSVIMTIEGLVLFDAQAGAKLTVHRAIAPFDSDEFAKGIMRDIQLILFAPGYPSTTAGTHRNGSYACRYGLNDGETIDVILHDTANWEIHRYNDANRLIRTVSGKFKPKPKPYDTWRLADTIELTAHPQPGYHLLMMLIEATEIKNINNCLSN